MSIDLKNIENLKSTTLSINRVLTVREDVSHFQVAGGQPDNRRFVQLAGDGRRQRQEFGQLLELGVLVLSTRPGRIPAPLSHFCVQFENKTKKKTRIKQRHVHFTEFLATVAVLIQTRSRGASNIVINIT